jgi:gliding motility associated protien GldN
MMKQILTIVLVALSGASHAQRIKINGGPVNVSEYGIVDGVYITEHVPTKRMIPYEFVREADVIWSRRVWRTIDMREKINHTMYFPFDSYDAQNYWSLNSSRWSLWTIMKYHIMQGDLTMFSPDNPYDFNMKDGDQFKYPIVPEEGRSYNNDSIFRQTAFQYLGKLGPQPITPIPDSNGDGDSVIYLPDGTPEYVYPPRDTIWILSKDIVQYRIKEDWFFDKERSVMDVRILGIAPVIYNKDDNGQILGLRETFWLYFPHCRYIFNNYFVYNEHNDAQWMSFDDLFWKRRFSSTIYKESNVFDREVESYRTGVDALMESEKITEEIRNFEHDVWNF